MNLSNKIRNEFLGEYPNTLQEIYVSQLHKCQNYLVNRGMANKEDAKDIYSDAILILRNNVIKNKLKANSNLKSYLLGICMNLARTHYRDRKKSQTKEEEVRSLLYDDSVTTNHHESTEILKLCKQALELIEPKGKRILELYYFENYSMSQIAKELGYSSSDAAKTAKYRAFKKWITEANKLRKIYFESI